MRVYFLEATVLTTIKTLRMFRWAAQRKVLRRPEGRCPSPKVLQRGAQVCQAIYPAQAMQSIFSCSEQVNGRAWLIFTAVIEAVGIFRGQQQLQKHLTVFHEQWHPGCLRTERHRDCGTVGQEADAERGPLGHKGNASLDPGSEQSKAEQHTGTQGAWQDGHTESSKLIRRSLLFFYTHTHTLTRCQRKRGIINLVAKAISQGETHL